MTTLDSHWFGLPPDGYYQKAACTDLNENARFWDDTDTKNLHGNAICTIDCIYPHKNSILPLTYVNANPTAMTYDCYGTDRPSVLPPYYPRPDAPMTCSDALAENASRNTFSSYSYWTCDYNTGFTGIQSGNFISRVKIWDLTWSHPAGLDPDARDFTHTDGLYTPLNPDNTEPGGTLLNLADARVVPWLKIYGDTLDTISKILTDCTFGTNSSDQGTLNLLQDTVNRARTAYFNAFGTSVVGGYLPLTLNPGPLDKAPSMFVGAQYVLDISDKYACPLITDFCQTGGLMGQWRFSLASMSTDDKIRKLPEHICQNFSDTVPNGSAWLPPPNVALPSNRYIAGMGKQPDANSLISTTEPQSAPGYVYRSCALQRFTAPDPYCCANDFADGANAATIFNPSQTQLPAANPQHPDTHRSPLIGYNYESETPWYRNCFDKTGLTCDTRFRDITSDGCSAFMLPHCAISPESSDAQSWDTVNGSDGSSECSRWLGRLLYGADGAWIAFYNAVASRGTLRDRTGTKLSTDILSTITTNFHKVFTMENIKSGNMTPLAVAMEPVIFTLYNNYNLNLYDDNILVNQCSIYSTDDVVENPMLRRWCGCMLSGDSYFSRYPGISIACTPMCNSSDVIQYGSPCQGTLCVLDSITVSLVDTTHGAISLSQVCKSCGEISNTDTQHVRQTCTCDVRDVSIDAIDSQLGNISIKAACEGTGNAPAPAPVSQDPPATRVLKAFGNVSQTFPYTALLLLVTAAILAVVAYIISRGMREGVSHLWARGLAAACFIIAGIIFIAIAYTVVMRARG